MLIMFTIGINRLLIISFIFTKYGKYGIILLNKGGKYEVNFNNSF